MKHMTIRNVAVFCLVFFSAICVAGTGFAGDVEKGTKDKKKVHIWSEDHTIDVGTPKKVANVKKDGRGTIERFDPKNNDIVIDDSQKTLADDVKYFKANGNGASEADFEAGKKIEWVLGPDRKIIQLYLRDEKKKNEGP